MTRANFLKYSGLLTAGIAGSAVRGGLRNASASAGKERKPNVIFIFCDDLGWADLPCHGHRSVKAHGGWTVRGELKMPNVDRMAREGTIFTQFYELGKFFSFVHFFIQFIKFFKKIFIIAFIDS